MKRQTQRWTRVHPAITPQTSQASNKPQLLQKNIWKPRLQNYSPHRRTCPLSLQNRCWFQWLHLLRPYFSVFQRWRTCIDYAGRMPQQRDFLVPPSLEYCVALEHSSYFSISRATGKQFPPQKGERNGIPPPKYRNNKFRQEITRYPSSAILANPTASSSAGH